MIKAVFNNKIVAESEETAIVEGNHYFPKEKVNMEYLSSIDKTTICHWKGTANYCDVIVDGVKSAGGAWYYENPSDEARHIKSMIAFWNGIEVIEE